MLTNILLVILIVGGAAWALLSRKQTSVDNGESIKLKAQIDQLNEKKAELDQKLKDSEKENNKLIGDNKSTWAQNERLEAKNASLLKENEALQKKVSKFEDNEEHNEETLNEKLEKLDASKEALDRERERVTQHERERLEEEQEERDRIWNDHENTVIAIMNELVTRPEYRGALKGYSNTKLPDGFDGSLKPDFLVEFGSQYVVFDAKCTKSDDLTTYIRDAVKSTVKKVKGKTEIYPTLFFVVPTMAIPSLKKTSFYETGFTFHVVSPEALAPILAVLKRMTEYEFVEQMDPEERENIVNILARYSQFISWKGAHDIISTQMGADLLRDTEVVLPEIAKEVELKKKKLGLLKPKPSEIMKLAASADEREEMIKGLVSPRATITKKSLRETVEMDFE